MPKRESGVVNTWNVEKQYGFVSINSGKPDAFLHTDNILDRELREEVKTEGLKRGEKITFDLEPPTTGKGKMVAINIEVTGRGGRGGGGRGRSRSGSRRRARSLSRRPRHRSRSPEQASQPQPPAAPQRQPLSR
ncbi:unnamed protein product [Prorocentrum cordatum]|uniref:CSD domain-containing protein n=1 Tax=Prorocentrum cordatum TaxID=2364126 RepID=A0ABN9PQ26_9DINO|nr:unnamed protein product [Polarella glacialis]